MEVLCKADDGICGSFYEKTTHSVAWEPATEQHHASTWAIGHACGLGLCCLFALARPTTARSMPTVPAQHLNLLDGKAVLLPG